jgi:hypothetical protein
MNQDGAHHEEFHRLRKKYASKSWITFVNRNGEIHPAFKIWHPEELILDPNTKDGTSLTVGSISISISISISLSGYEDG